MAVSGRQVAQATKAQQYTFGKKLKAFSRGLSKNRPFLEIAEEGLRKEYSLTHKQEERYLRRFGGSSDISRLAKLFGPTMPEKRQLRLAERIVFDINFIPLQVESSEAYGWSETAAALRYQMIKLRSEVTEALYMGRVTSLEAQLTLAGCFTENSIDENDNGTLRKVASQKVILPTSKASEEFKEKIWEIGWGE